MVDKAKRQQKNIVLILLAFVILYFFTGWYSQLLTDYKLLAFTIYFLNLALVWQFVNKGRRFKLAFITLFIVLALMQIKTTRISNEYKTTPFEKDLQITRMNYYPPKQARVGYILESKKETQYIYTVQNHFFDAINLLNYFPEKFSYLTLPFFFVGLYLFVDSSKRLLQYSLLSSVVILSVIGTSGLFGPFVIYPFISLFVILGVLKTSSYVFKYDL